MLITLLAWLYISFLCWTWGKLFLSALQKTFAGVVPELHFSFVCLTGLSVITIIAAILSLFIALGNWWVQLIFLIPPLIFMFRIKDTGSFHPIKKILSEFHLFSLLLLLSCLLMILVMSTWTIVHPDTLGYHAQTIQWIEKYKAVPGLVNLHVRFGYQGLWFVDCALFGFSFTGVSGITFLNTTVLLWFFVFVISRINHYFFIEENKLFGFAWLAFLFISCWSYTQARLTATSASPDFIAALFVWAISWSILEQPGKHVSASRWMLISFLSLVAVTIKISIAPILLLVAAFGGITLIQKKMRSMIYLLALAAITIFPLITRNIITSGYTLFPVPGSGIINTDWKLPKQNTIHEKNYITAYAKYPGIKRKDNVATAAKNNPAEWLPGWWNQRSIADKTIIILLIVSLILDLLFVKRVFSAGIPVILLIITLLIGIIFWFIQAPDTRFGFGQIIGHTGVAFYFVFKEKKILIPKIILVLILIAFFALVSAYTGYRFKNFFSYSQWVIPLGIEKTGYTTIDCKEIKINVPYADKDFGNIPVPCTDLGCDEFEPRGGKVADGFKPKEFR